MRRKSQEEVYEYYKNEGYELLCEYKNNRTPLVVKCPKGHIFDTMTFWSFKKGNRCPICSHKAKLTYEFVKNEFEKEGYSLISSEYKNANSKLITICPNGHEWNTTYARFYSGKRCGRCANNQKLEFDFIKSEFEKEGYKLLSLIYNKASEPLIVRCPNGHIINTLSWNNFQRGTRCIVCNESKGERSIKHILEKYNIDYDWQVEYDGLVGLGGGNLSYDFHLSKYNLLIEYQGEFHDGTVPHQTQEEFEKQQEHDRRKRQYANNHNINLLEIWYWDFDNIEKILCKELNIKLRRKGNKQLK